MPELPPESITITLAPVPPRSPSFCTVDGCEKRSRSRGLCNAHYLRAKRALRRQQRETISGKSS